MGKTLVSTGLLTFDANPAVKACVNLDLSNWLKTKRLFILTIFFNVPRNSFMLIFFVQRILVCQKFLPENKKWKMTPSTFIITIFSGLGFKCFKCVTIERLLSKPNLQKQSQKQFAAPQNRLPIFAKCFFLLKFRLDGWLAVPAVCRNRTSSKILFKNIDKNI